MTFGAEMKQKMDEVHLQEKAKDFGDAVAEVLKAAVSLAGDLAQENRDKVDGVLDKAERLINERTDGKHSETVLRVRATVAKGIDSLAQQGSAQPDTTRPESPAADSVPDDQHSAFDDDEPRGPTA